MATLELSDNTYRKLVEVARRLEERWGESVSLEDAINYMIRKEMRLFIDMPANKNREPEKIYPKEIARLKPSYSSYEKGFFAFPSRS